MAFLKQHLAESVGEVVEMREVSNGVYAGFPTGSDIRTFDGTCSTQFGSKNVVIALREKPDTYEVVKIKIN